MTRLDPAAKAIFFRPALCELIFASLSANHNGAFALFCPGIDQVAVCSGSTGQNRQRTSADCLSFTLGNRNVSNAAALLSKNSRFDRVFCACRALIRSSRPL